MSTITAASYVQVNGLPLTAWEDSGVQWITSDVKGLGATNGTAKPVQKPRQSGAWAGTSYATPRTIVITGTTSAPTPALAVDALDRLNSAVTLADAPVMVNQSGISRSLTARRDGDVLPVWLNAQAFSWSVQMVATDWRMFGTPIVQSVGVIGASGGFTVPFTVPLTISSTISSGQITAVNPGNETDPVVLRVFGPCPGPSITHVSSQLSLTFSSSLVLGIGEWLDINMEAKTVLANGQASRSQWITSRGWFGFDPGVNELTFSASGSAPSASLTATLTPAWE